jgi:hypothetical protein
MAVGSVDLVAHRLTSTINSIEVNVHLLIQISIQLQLVGSKTAISHSQINAGKN